MMTVTADPAVVVADVAAVAASPYTRKKVTVSSATFFYLSMIFLFRRASKITVLFSKGVPLSRGQVMSQSDLYSFRLLS